jgi:DNA polymerase III epsilon subunit-like protein
MNEMSFQQVLKSDDYLVLDTETTGLHAGEVCQIAVMSSKEEILLNTLVKTVRPVPEEATRIHGITNDMVLGSPCWRDIVPRLEEILSGRMVLIYNAPFDLKMMAQSNRIWNLSLNWWEIARYACVMDVFARIYGEWSDYHLSYTWQKLTTAANYFGVRIENAHDALGDVRMTLGVCRGILQHLEGKAARE